MRTVRANGVQGAMVLLMVLLLTAGCARRCCINVDVEGGNASGVDWRIGIPF